MELLLSIISDFMGNVFFEGIIKVIRVVYKSLKGLIMIVFQRKHFLGALLYLVIGCNSTVQKDSEFRSANSTILLMQATIDVSEELCDSAFYMYGEGMTIDSIINKYKQPINKQQSEVQQFFEDAKLNALEGRMTQEDYYRIVNTVNIDSLKYKLKVLSDLGIRFFE